MDPITQSVFSMDYQRFVTQDLLKELPPQGVDSQKKFDLKDAAKADKAKKEADKQKEKKKRPFDMDKD